MDEVELKDHSQITYKEFVSIVRCDKTEQNSPVKLPYPKFLDIVTIKARFRHHTVGAVSGPLNPPKIEEDEEDLLDLPPVQLGFTKSEAVPRLSCDLDEDES